MKREEQIFQAAWKYDRENPSYGSEDYKVEGFIAGAKWADSHPNWHKYPEDKPTEDNDYTVCIEDSDGDLWMDRFPFSTKEDEFGYYDPSAKWESIDKVVRAWMKLIQFPKFD